MGGGTLLLHVSCSALSEAHRPALLIGKIPALLLGFSLVVLVQFGLGLGGVHHSFPFPILYSTKAQ